MTNCNDGRDIIGAVSLGFHEVPDLVVDFRDQILKSVNDLICHPLHVSSLLRIVDDPVTIGAINRALRSVERWIRCLDSVVQVEGVQEDRDIMGQLI
ncbi:MAG: hypothetical protein ACPH2J_09240 [Akkermansiaceae bacterium]